MSKSDAVKSLIKKLKDVQEDPYIRLEIAGSLARLGRIEGLDFSSENLKAESPEIRFRTVLILGEVAEARAVTILSNVLSNNSEHPEIRAAAAQSIGKISDVQIDISLKSLTEAFSYSDIRIRKYAAEALIGVGERAVPYLIATLGVSSVDISAGAAWCLARIGRSALNSLVKALDDRKKWQWIAFALGKMDKRSVKRELDAIKDQYAHVHFATTTLLSIPAWINELEGELLL